MGETALHIAAFGDNESVVRYLLGAGAVIEARNDEGDTAIHKAARNDSVKVAKILIPYISLLERNRKDETALHIAAKYNSAKVANILCECLHFPVGRRGERAKYGDTPLHYAAWKDSADVARILIKTDSSRFDASAYMINKLLNRTNPDGES